jgi:hypothetical protein
VRRSSGDSFGAAVLRMREREGEWCGVKRRWCRPFYNSERSWGKGVEAVARAQWPAAIDGGGSPVERRFREGEAGQRVGVRVSSECPAWWGGEGAREVGEAAGMRWPAAAREERAAAGG